jgi:hypothetical protein
MNNFAIGARDWTLETKTIQLHTWQLAVNQTRKLYTEQRLVDGIDHVFSTTPIYGCLTGIDLPQPELTVLPGIILSKTYVDTIGTTMLAFAPPPTPRSPHPTPFVGMQGVYSSFQARTQIELTSECSFLVPAETLLWLIAAVLRVRIPTPIRIAAVSNTSFDVMKDQWQKVLVYGFENSSTQIGSYAQAYCLISDEELAWLKDMLPSAINLYNEDKFKRAFTIFEQAQWATTVELAAILIWTAVEILFGLSNEREKKKAISRALSDYIAKDRSDRDRAYQVIEQLYYKRGQTVHAGHEIDHQDFIQVMQIAKVAFQKALITGKLPA